MIKIVNEVDFSGFDDNDLGGEWEDEIGVENAAKMFVSKETDIDNPKNGVDYTFDNDESIVKLKNGKKYFIATKVGVFNDVFESIFENKYAEPEFFAYSKYASIESIANNDEIDDDEKLSAIYTEINDVYMHGGYEDIQKMVEDDWSDIWEGFYAENDYYYFYTDISNVKWVY